ncbi:lipocalin-like domain-containing protein [Georgenia faecalis]|uniref:Lipocalin-like domain-containing protein n=1 Tax=Georgenia faecalis TaxID=2483799 RepID=A0ABV9D7G5_9MICO|nr:lipocalin-like domain-containing protein [Georgenia faecalis]
MSAGSERPVRDRSQRIPLGLGEQLVGAWRLVAYTRTGMDGAVSHPLGEGASGSILYTPDGYVSVQLAAAGATDPDERGAVRYLAYAGPFAVSAETGRLIHEVVVSVDEEAIGGSQEWEAQLEAGTLTLRSGPEDPGTTLVLEREAPRQL